MFYLGKLRNFIIFSNLYSKGIMRENLAEYKQSIHCLFLAVSLNPNSINCNKAIIRVCKKYKQFYEALDFCSKAIGRYPNNAQLYAMKADIHRKLKEYNLAIVNYDSAIKIDYSNIDYYKKRAQIKYYTNDIQGAINDLTSAISWNNKDYELYRQRAFYKFEKHNYEGSQEDYKQALKLKKNSAHCYYMLYAINELLNNPSISNKFLTKAIELNQNIKY